MASKLPVGVRHYCSGAMRLRPRASSGTRAGLETQPVRPMTPFPRGNQAYARKQYEAAIAEFVRHARDFPEEAANALASAGKCCLHVNTLDGPRNVAPGVTLVHKGNRAGAEHCYRAALDADPDQFAAPRGLAEVLAAKSPERLAVLERAASLRPDLLVLIDRGDCYRSVLKDYDRAYAAYRRSPPV